MHILAYFVVAATPPTPAVSRDQPVAADEVLYIDSADGAAWHATPVYHQARGRNTATRWNKPIHATVPGDVITDLQRAGYIGDPWLGDNFLNQSSVWSTPDALRYEANITSLLENHGRGHPRGRPRGNRMLVLDGVKMGAAVSVNGKELGQVNDQHLRYTFPLAGIDGCTTESGNGANPHTTPSSRPGCVVAITFDKTIQTHGRFMASSGGWDWVRVCVET